MRNLYVVVLVSIFGFAPASFADQILAASKTATEKALAGDDIGSRDADSGPADSTAERAEMRALRKAKIPVQKCDLQDSYCLQRQQQSR